MKNVFTNHIILWRAIFNDDGENEILTTVQLVDYPGQASLKVFNGRRERIKNIPLSEEVKYNGRINTYSSLFEIGSFLVRESRTSGKKEIFLLGNSLERSPSAVFRLDYQGNHYW